MANTPTSLAVSIGAPSPTKAGEVQIPPTPPHSPEVRQKPLSDDMQASSAVEENKARRRAMWYNSPLALAMLEQKRLAVVADARRVLEDFDRTMAGLA